MTPKVAKKKRMLMTSPVPDVEKLILRKFAKIKSRQDALQAIFSDRETFCIPQILAICIEMGLFQQARLISETDFRVAA